MISILLSGLLAALLWYKFIKPLGYWRELGVKQSNPWPILGDTWLTIFRRLSFAEFIEWVYNMYPNSRYSGFYRFTKPILMVKDPELIKQITVKDFEYFTDRVPLIDPEGDPLLGGSLTLLQGHKWREMRARLSGSFTSSKMKKIFHLMEETSQSFIKYFSDKNEESIEFDLKDIFTRFTNDVIASAAFGIKCYSLTEPNNEFYLMGKELTNINIFSTIIKIAGYIIFPKVFRALNLTLFPKELQQFFARIINETIQIREEQGIVRNDMINLLLEAKKGIKHEENEAVETGFATVKEFAYTGKFKHFKDITNDDIISQALVFLFAGFETVSTAMCFSVYELAVNKDIQDRLRDEINETNTKVNGEVTYDDLLKMKYLDMVISEVLRKWPPAVMADRLVVKPYTIEPVTHHEKAVHLKPGDVVLLPFHGLHRDRVFYSDPEKFDPERFSDENKHGIRHYAYMPFGSGPRNCIGSRFALLELKSLFFNLLLNFEIVPSKKLQIPLKLDKSALQNVAVGGFWFELRRIKT